MFRFEIGAHILVRRPEWEQGKTIEVEIQDKVPCRIKAEILTDGWFRVGEVHWLSDIEWVAMCRVRVRR